MSTALIVFFAASAFVFGWLWVKASAAVDQLEKERDEALEAASAKYVESEAWRNACNNYKAERTRYAETGAPRHTDQRPFNWPTN